MQELRERFGRLVAANRKKAGMTQDALSATSGVSVDMISRIESGATGARFTTIAKLASALGVDAAELFTADLKPASGGDRPQLQALTARLGKLSDRDLAWVSTVIEAALKDR